MTETSSLCIVHYPKYSQKMHTVLRSMCAEERKCVCIPKSRSTKTYHISVHETTPHITLQSTYDGRIFCMKRKYPTKVLLTKDEVLNMARKFRFWLPPHGHWMDSIALSRVWFLRSIFLSFLFSYTP